MSAELQPFIYQAFHALRKDLDNAYVANKKLTGKKVRGRGGGTVKPESDYLDDLQAKLSEVAQSKSDRTSQARIRSDWSAGRRLKHFARRTFGTETPYNNASSYAWQARQGVGHGPAAGGDGSKIGFMTAQQVDNAAERIEFTSPDDDRMRFLAMQSILSHDDLKPLRAHIQQHPGLYLRTREILAAPPDPSSAFGAPVHQAPGTFAAMHVHPPNAGGWTSTQPPGGGFSPGLHGQAPWNPQRPGVIRPVPAPPGQPPFATSPPSEYHISQPPVPQPSSMLPPGVANGSVTNWQTGPAALSPQHHSPSQSNVRPTPGLGRHLPPSVYGTSQSPALKPRR